jgi:hypothetical protein
MNQSQKRREVVNFIKLENAELLGDLGEEGVTILKRNLRKKRVTVWT